MSLDAYTHLSRAPDPGAPLVFAFHGTGGTEQQFAGLVPQILPGAGLVAPRGDVLEGGAARFFRRRAEGIYDMADLAARTEKMAGFVRAHAAQHPGAPVYGLGYSNGANILASLLLAHPDLFERAALLHPLIPWQPGAVPGLRGRKVLITAGRNDPIGPWPLTEALVETFETNGATVSTAFHPGGHEIREDEIAALARFLSPEPVPA